MSDTKMSNAYDPNEHICNILIPTNFETEIAGIANPNGDVSTKILRF